MSSRPEGADGAPRPASAEPDRGTVHTSGRGVPGGVRWRVLAVLVTLSFVAYVLRTNMSVAGEGMMRDLGLSPLELGMVLAAFAWGYALFQFPGGLFGDRLGPRRALTLIALAWGLLNLLTALVPGTSLTSTTTVLVGLISVRFLMGLFQAPVFPTIAGAIGNWFPVAGWGLPNGLSSSGLTLGAAATGPLIAWLVTGLGWRLSFALTAPLGLAGGLLWWWYGRDRPGEHPSVEAAELELIEAGRPPVSPVEPGAWRVVLADRNILLLTLSYFLMNYVFYIFFNWFFVYLVRVRGFEALEGGFVATVPWLVGAVGAAVGGWWCDAASRARGIRWGCRIPALVSLPLVAVLLWAGAAADSAGLAVVLLALCFGATQLTEAAYWSAVISVAGRRAAAASGVMNTGGNAVGGVGALLVPWMAEQFGWIAALSTGSLFALLGAVLWLFIRPDEALETRHGRAAAPA
ncbi:MAG: MFS transporter [Thermoanaerobaculia bacterium]|nr:MFS transporter [Thermoanaerobaculia bacterium]